MTFPSHSHKWVVALGVKGQREAARLKEIGAPYLGVRQNFTIGKAVDDDDDG